MYQLSAEREGVERGGELWRGVEMVWRGCVEGVEKCGEGWKWCGELWRGVEMVWRGCVEGVERGWRNVERGGEGARHL